MAMGLLRFEHGQQEMSLQASEVVQVDDSSGLPCDSGMDVME